MAAAYEAKRPDWTVAVAFRMLRPEDRCYPVKFYACLMCCTDTAHVELLLRRPCLGPKLCRYNHEDTLNGKNDSIHDVSKNGGYHVLSYAIRDMPGDNTVICAVDPLFQREAGWVFYGLRMTDRQMDSLERFCESQVGGGYRCKASLCCNWWCACCCCCCVPNFCFGTSIKQAQKSAYMLRDDNDGGSSESGELVPRPWFCSEFIAAALIHSGFLSKHNPLIQHPAKTSPEGLRKILASMSVDEKSAKKVYTLDIYSTRPEFFNSQPKTRDSDSDSDQGKEDYL